MITEQDLQEAIAECKGQRNPNAATCIKLAAFLILQRELYGTQDEPQRVSYSYAEPPNTTIRYDSGTEFGDAVNGMPVDRLLPIMDELMEALYATNKPLYKAAIRKLTD